jgi:hypothetical protein
MGVMDGANRSLTKGEKNLLFSVYMDSLDLSDQDVGVNLLNIGGETNSFTPADTPYFSSTIWTNDFSTVTDDGDKWVFVHEFGHVWQYAIGMNKAVQMLAINDVYNGDYEAAYSYDLARNSNLSAFNMEQQASIIADFFFVVNKLPPLKNVGKSTTLNDYMPYITQVRSRRPADASILDKLVRLNPFSIF